MGSMALPLRFSPKIIEVDRSLFTAQIWYMKTGRYARGKQYTIAVGREGYETPRGVYFVQKKEYNPSWLPPDADWVGPDLRDPVTGKPVRIPGGDPRNPLAGCFIWLGGGDGVGFHGVPAEEDFSVGTAASHGCLRMHVADVLDLAGRVALGTPVIIYG